ncbi:PepSY-associated TM helix domain-containing protein [Zhongshania sp. BJYM1]|uniref:PepSY-associated TM helix domain-containing protein n=1 Tax=Zhongshania aquatica TaxID=2965069 RepID=UPI0022B3500A|nr:PepSY domain-containing protein [Marortus sp. BJYM1]
MSGSEPSLPDSSMAKQREPIYRAMWRWHFYAGVFVIPFLFMLSVSGLLMLISKPIEPLLHQELTTVAPTGNALPASALLAVVRAHYPDAVVKMYLPPSIAKESARFSLSFDAASAHAGHNASSTVVYINPYSGEVLGALDPAETLYAKLQAFHSSLFLGDPGDSLIEIAAGLTVLMVLTGLYLAWFGKKGEKPTVTQQPASSIRDVTTRAKWRQLHRMIGQLIAIPLLFFLISGLAWTNVWGGKLVQAWSSLPGTRFEAPKSQHLHQSMNEVGIHQTPWALEQTPLPTSAVGKGGYSLDSIVKFAETNEFTQYRVHLPGGSSGVWTISATTIAGDLTNPFAERILHIDQSNGKVLADLSFGDYPTMGKAMAAFIPFHQGDLGWWNWLLNIVFVIAVIILIVGGIALWWKRRPAKVYRLLPPTASHADSRKVAGIMLIISLLFPLSAALLVLILLVDHLFVSRFSKLRSLIK